MSMTGSSDFFPDGMPGDSARLDALVAAVQRLRERRQRAIALTGGTCWQGTMALAEALSDFLHETDRVVGQREIVLGVWRAIRYADTPAQARSRCAEWCATDPENARHYERAREELEREVADWRQQGDQAR